MAVCDSASSLHNVIAHAIDSARAQGVDDWHQYDGAVRAVMRVEPDLTMQAATRLVNTLLEKRDRLGVCH